MSPRLKYQSETENESSASRSRLRRLSGRRRSARPKKKSAQKPSQSGTLLTSLPPKAPGEPRAIFHATCGPAQASVTAPLVSSTLPVATSPALPHQTLTVQTFFLKVVSTVRFVSG